VANVREEALLTRIAVQQDLSRDGVKTVLDALRRGNGMAQFSHPDFGGMSQWAPGMVMVGAMSNTGLKAKLDKVATELAAYLKDEPAPAASARSSSGGDHASGSADAWWPRGLGSPSTSGAQNAMRYAFFPDARRLAIDDHGALKLYDTGEHRISGVSQSQSTASTLTFTSQNGVVDLVDVKQIPMDVD